MTPRRDAKFGHHNARSQSLDCRLTIDEKMPNGLDVLAALGLRLLRFLTGWARNNMSAFGGKADSATASRDVRYWHLTDSPTAPTFVRFRTIADKVGFSPGAVCPLMTQSGH
jgi:hypothetical protein